MNIETLGQVFTPNNIVDYMISLIRNTGSILEPSCGDGAFFKKLPNCTGIELDAMLCPNNALNMDFFDFSLDNKFDTIIGNPPYVKYINIQNSTKSKLDMSLFDNRSNLYLFFIEKCIKHLNPHGELIFIVPRELLKSTSAIKLNNLMYREGTITDFIDLGDSKIFKNACPNCIIFRFEKGNFNRKLDNGKIYFVNNGQIYFSETTINKDYEFNSLFYVKVGAVSGADNIFESPYGNRDFVYSKTCKTGLLKKMIYNTPDIHILPYKEQLLNRQIKKFKEDEWYMWGRGLYESNSSRIYVNSKTRNEFPFFYNDCKNYDGSILAIFPNKKVSKEKCIRISEILNSMNWEDIGFKCDGRYIFTQKSLENCILDENIYKEIVKVYKE